MENMIRLLYHRANVLSRYIVYRMSSNRRNGFNKMSLNICPSIEDIC